VISSWVWWESFAILMSFYIDLQGVYFVPIVVLFVSKDIPLSYREHRVHRLIIWLMIVCLSWRHMILLLISMDTLQLWLHRDHILHHLFNWDLAPCHINILIIDTWVHSRVEILGMVGLMLTNILLQKRYHFGPLPTVIIYCGWIDDCSWKHLNKFLHIDVYNSM
jgi:hypothetical protein